MENFPTLAVSRLLASTFLAVSCGTTLAQSSDNIFQGAFDEPTLGHMDREWILYSVEPDGPRPDRYPTSDPEDRDRCLADECEAVFDFETYGPSGGNYTGEAEIFSNETGVTYWANAVAPGLGIDAFEAGAIFRQKMYFRRTEQAASLTLKITATDLEGLDGDDIGGRNCVPPGDPNPAFCSGLRGTVRFRAMISPALDNRNDFTFYRVGGFATLSRRIDDWHFSAWPSDDSEEPLWSRGDFDLNLNVDGSGRQAEAKLKTPFPVELPLDDIAIGDAFLLEVEVSAVAIDQLKGEVTSMTAFFRDPLETGGVEVETEGLEAVNGPVDFFPGYPTRPEPDCDGPPIPAAGSLAWEATSHTFREGSGGSLLLDIERSGGSEGAVSSAIRTLPGTATSDVDFGRVDSVVRFADGESGSKQVEIFVLQDDVLEETENFFVELAEPGGCVAIGSSDTAEISIVDDELPDGPPTFTVGGTVSGAVGSGLQLALDRFFQYISVSNGPYAFSLEKEDGDDYEVTIDDHPSNPAQICTVENGIGQIDGANVTDVDVTCTTPAQSASLDTTFGADGRVTDRLSPPAVDIAEQQDGKLLVAGGNRIRRYDSVGDIDLTFGTDGQAELNPFTTGVLEAMALQSDGKIVVVGQRSGDFVIHRVNMDGTLDTAFGTDGLATVDFTGGFDRANDVVIQSDGKIVVGGSATAIGNDFAAARLSASGVLDSSFGTDGKITVDVAGNADLAYGIDLQADGKVVLAGRVAASGAGDPDFGIVRLTSAGLPDSTFGVDGIVIDETADIYEEIFDVIAQPDGKIVVAGFQIQMNHVMDIRRYDSNGTPDSTFGVEGRVTDFTFDPDDAAYALALQSDGKLIVAGVASPELFNGDFAVGRLLVSGAPDNTFGTDGQVVIEFFGASDAARAVLVDSAGRIVVAGAVTNVLSRQLGMARINP